MSKSKKSTLRQRLRASAAVRLATIQASMDTACERVSDDCDTDIDMHDVMRLICNKQNKTVREGLITALANEAETKLEALYNRQQNLLEPTTDNLIPKEKTK